MTKRKTTQKSAPTINSTPPKQAVGSVEAKNNTVATPKPKRANSKAPAKPRGRPKKTVVEPKVEINLPAPVSKAVDVDSRTITYVDPRVLTKHVVTDYGVEPKPSKYGQFKAWLVFKLYVVTSYFRGY